MVLAGILDTAVKDGRLSKNPARDVDLPRLPSREHTYLNHAQVKALAEAAGDYRPLILVLAYCGLRFGEAAALRVRNVRSATSSDPGHPVGLCGPRPLRVGVHQDRQGTQRPHHSVPA